MGHIFISYSHDDSTYAHEIAQHLQSLSFAVWIDERLDYGSQWPQELQKQLDTCSAFILIMSPRSYASEWVQSELQRARRKLKPIFPLLLEGDEPWLSVESTQYYDVRGGLFPDAEFYADLKEVLTRTSTPELPQTPKESIREIPAYQPAKPNRGAIVAGGILLILLIGGAVLLMPLFRGELSPTTESTIDEPISGAATQASPPPIISADPEMVLVPAGEFTMGRNAADELTDCLAYFHPECQLAWFTDAEPVHKVNLAAFYIDKYEVTNAWYKTCEEAGVCEPPQALLSNTRQTYYGNSEFDNYPVIQVTWEQAKTYCQWREARLPTEAEWEKAARGTDARTYPWGQEPDARYANFNWNIGDTTAVGSYASGESPYGLYDMSGNVWEWVSSLHGPYPYDAEDGRELLDAEGMRIVRGGGWGREGNNSVSTTYRFTYDPGRGSIDIGFRCAMDANP